MKLKQILNYLGKGLLVISVIYMVRNIVAYRESLTAVLTPSILGYSIICLLLYCAFVLIAGCLYCKLLCCVTGSEFNYGRVILIYSKSNLYKYLPGNVAHYLGRQEIAANDKAVHGRVAFCSIVEAGISCIASLLAALALSYGFVAEWLSTADLSIFFVVAAVGVLVIIILCFVFRKKKTIVIDAIKHYCTKRNVGWVSFMLIYNIINQIAIGLLFAQLLKLMNVALPDGYFLRVAGVYAFAWLAGFITPGVPGGIGIRESMLTLLLNSIVASEAIVAAVLINRMLTVLADALAYPTAFLLSKLLNKGVVADCE